MSRAMRFLPGILFLAAAVSVAHAGGTAIFDDFENYAAGKYPGGGWGMYYNALNDPAHNKVVDTVAHSGDKSLQLYGRHSGCWAGGAALALPAWDEPFLVGAAIRPGNEAGGGKHNCDAIIGLSYRISSGASCTDAEHLRFRGDRQIISNFGEPSTILAQDLTYIPHKWYRIRIGTLPAYKRLFYTVNGHYVGCTSVPKSRWPQHHFYFGLGSGDGIGWFDDVRAGTVGPAGPYLEPLVILTDAISSFLPTYSGDRWKPVDFPMIPLDVANIFATRDVPIPRALKEQCNRLKTEKKWIGALGDVLLKVTDAQGRSIDSEGGNIPEAGYLFEDLNGDGKKEVTVLLPSADVEPGKLVIDVVNPDAKNVVTCSLFFYDPALEQLTPIASGVVLEPGGSARYRLGDGLSPILLPGIGSGVVACVGSVWFLAWTLRQRRGQVRRR